MILKYLKACTSYPWYLSNMVAFLRLNLFVKFELKKMMDMPYEPPGKRYGPEHLQANLFDWGD